MSQLSSEKEKFVVANFPLSIVFFPGDYENTYKYMYELGVDMSLTKICHQYSIVTPTVIKMGTMIHIHHHCST